MAGASGQLTQGTVPITRSGRDVNPTTQGEDVTESQIIEMLTRLVSEVSDIHLSDGLDIDASFDDLGLDSLTQLELLSHIEAELGIQIPNDRLDDIRSVRSIMGLMREFSNERQEADV